jgi:hypothetical protein
MTRIERQVLDSLSRGGVLRHRSTGPVITLEGYAMDAGGESTIKALRAEGYLDGDRITDKGRVALSSSPHTDT